LQNAIGGHGLELLRLEQSVDQVRKKEYGGDTANDVIHLNVPLQVVASLSKKPANDKKSEGHRDVEEIEQHSNSKLTTRV
jgi:hypothetical protein